MTFWNEIKLWTWFISDSLKSKLLVLVQSMSKSCHPCCQEALSNQQHMRYDCWWWIDEQDLHQLQKPEPILWETRNATWTKTGWKIPLIFRLRRSSNQRKTLENIFIIYEMLIYITVVCPKKPGFPLEVANGEMEKSLGPILENSLCLGCLLFVQKKANSMVPNLLLTLDWGSYWSDGRPKRTMVFLCQEGWFLCHIGEERFTNSSPVIGMRRCCNQTPSFGEWFRGSGWGLCCSFFRLGWLSFFLECLL